MNVISPQSLGFMGSLDTRPARCLGNSLKWLGRPVLCIWSRPVYYGRLATGGGEHVEEMDHNGVSGSARCRSGACARRKLADPADHYGRAVRGWRPDGCGRPNYGARLGEILKQQVIVENVGGAGGMTGAERVAQAKPDGYEVLLGTVGTQAYSQTLYKKPLYNAMTDFAPVALVAEQPLVLVVRKDFPASNLKEFAAYAKANAAKLSFGSGGSGSATHLGCLLLNSAIGVDVQHVPYRGSAPALQDLMAGRIDYLCDAVSTELAPIKAGNVKPIAVLARQRSAVLPNVPTAQQEGLREF